MIEAIWIDFDFIEETTLAGKTVFVIDSDTLTNAEIKDKFMGRNISFRSKKYQVIGIEYQGMPDRIPSKTALMVKELKDTI